MQEIWHLTLRIHYKKRNFISLSELSFIDKIA